MRRFIIISRIQPALIGILMRTTNEEAKGSEKLSSAAASRCLKLLMLCNLMLKDTLREIILNSGCFLFYSISNTRS